MNEKIYTIPVTEAFEQGGECPFCNMYDRLEREGVNYALGPSYMEDDIRMETNKVGFCKRHYGLMYVEQNRLGLSLMLHTHMQELQKNLKKSLEGKKSLAQKKSLWKKAASSEDLAGVLKYIQTVSDSCYICNKINFSYERYVDTFFYLFRTDDRFVTFMREGRGFCLDHFAMLLTLAPQKLNAELEAFMTLLVEKQLASMDMLLTDLEWFINKFDYRFQNEPWKNAKDALPRGILKVSGLKVTR